MFITTNPEPFDDAEETTDHSDTNLLKDGPRTMSAIKQEPIDSGNGISQLQLNKELKALYKDHIIKDEITIGPVTLQACYSTSSSKNTTEYETPSIQTEEMKISNKIILRDDAMIQDSESETDFLNLIDVDMQVAEDNLKLISNEIIKKPRKKRKACRTLISNQNSDSETDNQDFSPSDGSDYDPDSASRFSDDSMNLASLSDVKNHPDNKRFCKKSLLEKRGSTSDISSLEPSFLMIGENNNQMSEDNLINLELNCTEKRTKNKNRTVTKNQKLQCAVDHNVPRNEDTSPMIIIKDNYEVEDLLEESSSDLDNKRPEQPEAKEQKKKRKWVRKNACIFCENLVTNFTRHLLTHHKNESEVLEYMSINDPDLNLRKQRRRQITDTLRNRGNFLHNSKVIFEREGDLIPKKGMCPVSNPSSFTTCQNCLATFKRKYFYKHFKTCGSSVLNSENLPDSYKKRVLENYSISIIPHLSAASQGVKDHILPRLRNDEISSLVKTDPLILAYGSRLIRKKKEARSRKVICSKLRDLGNLLLHLKTEDPSIKELTDLFKPQHYPTFMTCVKKMCGFNEKTGFVETISIPSRLRPSILGCIEVLYTEMIMGHGSQAYKESLKKQLDEFKILVKINWEWEISSNAEKSRKRKLMTKETVMPLDEDIRIITNKIHELEKSYSKQLKKDVTVLNYENLCEVTVAHVIVMDKKRAGDVAEAELCFYLNRKEEETPAKVYELLSDEQKDAIDQLDVFMIPGKRTRSVPVLLTKQMRRCIDLIVASRISVGVADNNPLLFARPLTSRPFDGGKCLNKIKSLCKLSNPKMLTSTGVRHHVATMSQLHSKKNDQYTEHLAGFLGHDLAVHSSNYRLPLQVIQKAVSGSSLMEFEKKRKSETVTSKSMEMDLEAGLNEPMELDMEKGLEESNNSIAHTEEQSKETRKQTQENYLIKQTKQHKAIDMIDITSKKKFKDGHYLLENEENKKTLENHQAGEEVQEKNYSEKTNEENEKTLENHQTGEEVQEKNYSKETDEIGEDAKNRINEKLPSEKLVDDKGCEMRQKENTNTAQEFSELNHLKGKSEAKRIVRNVKGQFQGNPHKSKIHKYEQKTCSTKSALQNAESDSDIVKKMITIEKLNRSKSRKSSSESSEEKVIDPKIEGPKDSKLAKKRRAQNLSEESPSSSDESQNVVETRRRKKTHTFWTQEELKALRTYFKDNIKNKTNPGKAKCTEVLRKVPVLSRRTWMQLNTQVNNIYKKKK